MLPHKHFQLRAGHLAVSNIPSLCLLEIRFFNGFRIAAAQGGGQTAPRTPDEKVAINPIPIANDVLGACAQAYASVS
jgi:hypothetical protein